ncbi:hypothetical protein G7Z17_g9448 [Cylindrodendrum hubeiense]|uniref:Defect at low temperature protein 1 n=1 Tax=Cylindrodendrum hubeiense TaxID=595255 RepID=A0A9P5H6R3_9HYPO|nr:hypothetical protein G7Z17_g9448 [Cylindrodendrum hubeiense]
MASGATPPNLFVKGATDSMSAHADPCVLHHHYPCLLSTLFSGRSAAHAVFLRSFAGLRVTDSSTAMASPAVSHRRLVFSIIYRTFYLLLYVVLIGLLIATPADAIQRSLRNDQLYNVWIIAAAYTTTILIVTFVFFTRLYINKTDLDSIPKGWVPIEKGDVSSAVYKVIAAGLGRSATIAYSSRPRLEPEDQVEQEESIRPQSKQSAVGSGMATEDLLVSLPRRRAVWGEIEHFGWASPTSPDLPNLQYTTVLSELPNLIEGKALTLAPPDPTSQTDPPILDPDAVALLQRTANMSLRDYIVHLAEFGVLELGAAATKFLSHYEYARFSNRPISNTRFKELMHLFAEILRAMEPFDPDILDGGQPEDDDTSSPSSIIEYDSAARTNPASNMSGSDAGSISSSTRRARRQASTNTWNVYRTAPNSLRSGLSKTVSHKPSVNSLAQSRRHFPIRQPSTPSLRSKSSGSSASVIRLATRHDSTDLPYILSLKDTIGN